jgi:hypothetical protein
VIYRANKSNFYLPLTGGYPPSSEYSLGGGEVEAAESLPSKSSRDTGSLRRPSGAKRIGPAYIDIQDGMDGASAAAAVLSDRQQQ